MKEPLSSIVVFSCFDKNFINCIRKGEGHLRNHIEMTRNASTTMYSPYLLNFGLMKILQ